MKNKITIMIFTLILLMTAVSFGDSTYESVLGVVRRDFKIYLNGQPFSPQDASGNPLYPVVINGSTYLPVRAVGNAANLDVKWDAQTNTIYLGDSSGMTEINTSSQVSNTPQANTEIGEIKNPNKHAESELNDTKETANDLVLDAIMTGTIGASRTSGKDTKDYYKVTVPHEGHLKFTLTNASDDKYSINFVGENSTQNKYVSTVGKVKSYEVFVKPGIYYAFVSGNKSDSYELMSNYTPLKEQTEPNDKKENAYSIKVGSTVEGIIGGYDSQMKVDHYDYYVFNVEEAKDYTIKLKTNEFKSAHLYLYLSSKTQELGKDNSGNVENREIKKFLEPGKYYIKVNASSESKNDYYKLSVE